MRRHTPLYYALLLTNIVYRPSREADSNSRKSNEIWTWTGKAHPDRRETSISNLLRQRNLKTELEVSLWKSKENAKKFKNETIAVIWDLRLRKPRSGKLNHVIIVALSFSCNDSRLTNKRKTRRLQIPPVWSAFLKSSAFMMAGLTITINLRFPNSPA